MVQIDIDPFINVRAMTELLQKASIDRQFIDRYMINNVSIRVRKKLELNYVNIDIDHKKIDTVYITSYQDTTDNYSKDKYILQ